MSGPVNRVAPGVPAGGQFAPDARARSAVFLDADIIDRPEVEWDSDSWANGQRFSATIPIPLGRMILTVIPKEPYEDPEGPALWAINDDLGGMRTGVAANMDEAKAEVVRVAYNLPQPSDAEQDWAIWSDPEVAADFHRLGFTPREAASWHSEGFTPDETYAWSRTDSGFDPSIAARWRDAGFDPHTASVWDGNRFTYIEAEPLAAIMQAHTAAAWRGRESAGWQGWAEQGFGPGEAVFFDEMGISPVEARDWHGSRFAAHDAQAWREKDFEPEQADLMRRNGFFPEQARRWIEEGHPLPPR